jgi:hypothetical protein
MSMHIGGLVSFVEVRRNLAFLQMRRIGRGGAEEMREYQVEES